MAETLQKKIQNQAYQIVGWQFAGIIVIAILCLVFQGTTGGLSVLAGGLAYILPTAIFVWRVFRYAGAQQMNQFMVAFFMGEALKLTLSGILFVLVVKYLPVSLLSVLAGFVSAIVLFWLVCIWLFGGVAR